MEFCFLKEIQGQKGFKMIWDTAGQAVMMTGWN